MSLCDDSTVEKLNRYFIPCFIDNIWNAPLDRVHPPADASPTLKAAYTNTIALLQEAMVPRPGQYMRSGVQSYIVRLDGTVEEGAEMMGQEPEKLVTRVLDQVLAETPVQPGERVARYVSQAPDPVPEDGIQLRMVARFAHPPSAEELEKMDAGFAGRPGAMYGPALQHPMRDWVVLSATEWRKLLPPSGAAVGTAYDIDPELASRIFIHFTTIDSPMFAQESQMESMRMGAKVDRNDAGGLRIVFQATYRMKNPGMHDSLGATVSPNGNRIFAAANGFLEVDGNGHLTDIEFATERAVDRTPHGFEMPFEAVAYRVATNPGGCSVLVAP